MNKPKFSPGPWCYEYRSGDHPNNRENGWGCEGLWSADGKLIFGLGPGWADRFNPPDTSDQHLIEAAPDLYAALEKAVADYGKPGGPWNVPSEPGTWLEMAKAALKKARGEE